MSLSNDNVLILTSFRSIDGFDRSEHACLIAATNRLNNN